MPKPASLSILVLYPFGHLSESETMFLKTFELLIIDLCNANKQEMTMMVHCSILLQMALVDS